MAKTKMTKAEHKASAKSLLSMIGRITVAVPLTWIGYMFFVRPAGDRVLGIGSIGGVIFTACTVFLFAGLARVLYHLAKARD